MKPLFSTQTFQFFYFLVSLLEHDILDWFFRVRDEICNVAADTPVRMTGGNAATLNFPGEKKTSNAKIYTRSHFHISGAAYAVVISR